MTTPRLYIACLASYNNGTLHGEWIEATNDLDTIWQQINTMLKNSPEPNAEEYAIHDYEGFNKYQISEYEGIERAHNIACFIEEHGDLGAELLSYYDQIEDAEKFIEENYHGCYQSLADYAEQFTQGTSDIPEHLAFYIDYEKMGRDWEISGDIFTIETGFQEVHIFNAY